MTTLPKLTRTMFHRLMTDPEYLAAMQHLYGAIVQLRDMDMRRHPPRPYHRADMELVKNTIR
jgi:hypothetical protein